MSLPLTMHAAPRELPSIDQPFVALWPTKRVDPLGQYWFIWIRLDHTRYHFLQFVTINPAQDAWVESTIPKDEPYHWFSIPDSTAWLSYRVLEQVSGSYLIRFGSVNNAFSYNFTKEAYIKLHHCIMCASPKLLQEYYTPYITRQELDGVLPISMAL